jgi:hypothetical protein
MNWGAIGSIGEIVGAFGVILSVLYLAIHKVLCAKPLEWTHRYPLLPTESECSAQKSHAARIFLSGIFHKAQKDSQISTDARTTYRTQRPGQRTTRPLVQPKRVLAPRFIARLPVRNPDAFSGLGWIIGIGP